MEKPKEGSTLWGTQPEEGAQAPKGALSEQKDPVMSSPLWRKAARIWLMPALSKAGPVGVVAISSQIQRALSYYDNDAMRNP